MVRLLRRPASGPEMTGVAMRAVCRDQLQYLHDPGGTGANHDAIVLGLKIGVTF